MKLEDALGCLENEEIREQLISKLKTAGEDSKPFQGLKEVLVSLDVPIPSNKDDEVKSHPQNFNKKQTTSKNKFSKNIVNHMFGFTTTQESFDQFCNVSKNWRNAVETKRVDMPNPTNIFESFLLSKMCKQDRFSFFVKFLRVFTKLEFFVTNLILQNWEDVKSLILKSMENLECVKIHLACNPQTLPPDFRLFIFKLLQNSNLNLTQIHLPKLSFFSHKFKFSLC